MFEQRRGPARLNSLEYYKEVAAEVTKDVHELRARVAELEAERKAIRSYLTASKFRLARDDSLLEFRDGALFGFVNALQADMWRAFLNE